MAEDVPGPAGSDKDHQPSEPPVAPSGASAPSFQSPPAYGQAGGYQQPAGYPPGPPTEGTAVAALVIAIAGFFICAPVGAIVALILARNAVQRIEAAGGRLSGLELARAARIIAIVELVLTAVVVLLGVVLGAIAITTRRSGDVEPVSLSLVLQWSASSLRGLVAGAPPGL